MAKFFPDSAPCGLSFDGRGLKISRRGAAFGGESLEVALSTRTVPRSIRSFPPQGG